MRDERGNGRRRGGVALWLLGAAALFWVAWNPVLAVSSPGDALSEAGVPGGTATQPAGATTSPDPRQVGPGEQLHPGLRLERILTVQDPRLEDDSPYHVFWFEAHRGQIISLSMRSDQVDPYLWLFGPDGELVARDDDSGPGPYDALVRAEAFQDGIYTVLANTALGWQRGRYVLLLTLEEPAHGRRVPPGGGSGVEGGDAGGGPRERVPGPVAPIGEQPGVRGVAAGAAGTRPGPSAPPVEGVLEPGVRRSATVGNTDLIRFWRVVLPEGQNRFEVGIFNATGPLDLVATPEIPIDPGVGDFPFKAMTGRENERLEVSLEEGAPRRWLVGVVNWEPVSIGYEIELTFDRPLPFHPEYKPPLPQTVAALSPLERAIRATVQISTPEGSASGTLVTPDGLILTNYHVVGECRFIDELFGCEGGLLRDEDGNLVELVVGLPHEARGAATQYFLAEVIKALPQYDLALLQITEDLNGIPVRGPIFPWIPLDLSPDAVRLGDEVMVIGYPAIAQTSGRIPLSLTRGVLSGFTIHQGRRVLLQTDAAIEAGHSGGALVRLPQARLVGVPSDTRLDWETFEKQNYARPVTLLPEDWLELLDRHGATLYGRRDPLGEPGPRTGSPTDPASELPAGGLADGGAPSAVPSP